MYKPNVQLATQTVISARITAWVFGVVFLGRWRRFWNENSNALQRNVTFGNEILANFGIVREKDEQLLGGLQVYRCHSS
jgi:hypothetical protein